MMNTEYALVAAYHYYNDTMQLEGYQCKNVLSFYSCCEFVCEKMMCCVKEVKRVRRLLQLMR